MDLGVFLEPKINLPRITTTLDELGPMGRLETIRGWDRATLRSLFEAASGYRKLSLEDYVPASVGPLTEVIHEGKNSLASPFSHFQKRFARSTPSTTGSTVTFGYNEQQWSGWTGPGYFVVVPGSVEGEVAIDYRKLPDEKVASWPDVAPNSARLGRFVYEGMVDIMRGISNHVTIGRARRDDKWMDAWFVLSRVDLD